MSSIAPHLTQESTAIAHKKTAWHEGIFSGQDRDEYYIQTCRRGPFIEGRWVQAVEAGERQMFAKGAPAGVT